VLAGRHRRRRLYLHLLKISVTAVAALSLGCAGSLGHAELPPPETAPCPSAERGYVFPSGLHMVVTREGSRPLVVLHVAVGEASPTDPTGHLGHLLEHVAVDLLTSLTPDGGRQSIGGTTEPFSFQLKSVAVEDGLTNSLIGVAQLLGQSEFAVTQAQLDEERRVMAMEMAEGEFQVPSRSRAVLLDDRTVQGESFARIDELRIDEVAGLLAAVLRPTNVCVELRSPQSEVDVQRGLAVLGSIPSAVPNSSESEFLLPRWDEVEKLPRTRELHYPLPVLIEQEGVGVMVVTPRAKFTRAGIRELERGLRRVARGAEARMVELGEQDLGGDLAISGWLLEGVGRPEVVAALVDRYLPDEYRYLVIRGIE
jgi:hypothetical protein